MSQKDHNTILNPHCSNVSANAEYVNDLSVKYNQ